MPKRKHSGHGSHVAQESASHSPGSTPGEAPSHEPQVGREPHAGPHEPSGSERAREQAMEARTKAGRTKMSVGQANTMRLKKGNQPRHG